MDQDSLSLLKKTVADMDVINTAVQDSFGLPVQRVLEPVLGEVDYDDLSDITKSNLNELVKNYVAHVRAALEGDIDIKAMDINQLKTK